MAFNIIASQQIGPNSESARSHSLTGNFLSGDTVIILTMPNTALLGTANASTRNYGLPTGFTPVTNLTQTSQNAIFYGYRTLTANQTNYTSPSYITSYNSFCAIIRGYVVKEAFVGTLPQTRNLSSGEVILLPGGAGQSGFTQFGYCYDTTAQYSGAYREFTANTSGYSVPNVTQYGLSGPNQSFIILTNDAAVPNTPTLTVNNTTVNQDSQVGVSWTYSDAAGSAQTKSQLRWRKV